MTTTDMQFRDYGYRCWSDVRPGDYVTFGRDLDMVRVVSIEAIPAENTATGDPDYVRVTVQYDGAGMVRTTAHKSWHHTTVFYAVAARS